MAKAQPASEIDFNNLGFDYMDCRIVLLPTIPMVSGMLAN